MALLVPAKIVLLSGMESAAISKTIGSGYFIKRSDRVCCVNTPVNGLYLKPTSLSQGHRDGLNLKHDRRLYD